MPNLPQREEHEQRIDPVQEERRVLEQPLDRRVAEHGERRDAPDQAHHARERRPTEHGDADRARGRAVDGENQDEREHVGRLVHDPERPDEVAEEVPVVRAAVHAREQEGHDADEAEQHRRQRHREQSALGTDGYEELRQLAAGGIAAADDHRLECKARQQESLEPGRARHQARQASTSRSNAGAAAHRVRDRQAEALRCRAS